MASIGMNLTYVAYGSTEVPFIDRFKTSDYWYQGNTGVRAATDQYGNALPSSLAAQGFVTTEIEVDPVTANVPHQYVMTWSGTGDLSVNTTTLSSSANQLVFDSGTLPFVQVRITGDSASDPVHDIHIVRVDQVGLYNSGEIFNPEFIEKASQWSTLRFMDWENTNASGAVSWATHSTSASQSWASNTANDGVPIDVMVKLCNEAHTDMWYNVPTQADDDYVQNALAYIRDNLDPSLKVHVEYSNEMWNWGFTASQYAQTQAAALWGHDTNGDGHVDPNNPAELMEGGWMAYYGYRAAQVASIAENVFGSDAATRLSTELGGQAAYTALSTYTKNGIALANVGSAGSLFSDYAVTTYFGGELDGGTPADQATILSWARSGAAGLDAAFHELEFGGLLQQDQSLDVMKSWLQSSAQFAHDNGMNLIAYEGGVHLTATAFASSVQTEITDFFQRLMDDPRMGDMYTKMVADFTAAGGTELNAYNDVNADSVWGYWGALDSIYDDGSPRYDALLAAQNGGQVVALAAAPLIGTASADALVASPLGGVLSGLGGNDTITAAAGNDQIDGGDGDDVIYGSSASTTADGVLTECDYYSGGAGADTIVGSVGNDHIYGNETTSLTGAVDGADSLMGGGGNDYIQGNAGNDTIDGGAMNDRLYGGADADSINGGSGFDYLQGNKGNDTLLGGSEDDTIHGGANNDLLYGDSGNDQLFGDDGNDRLYGGTGIDTMTGGAGGDFFQFGAGDAAFATTGINAFRMDEITDFADGIDSIALGFHVAGVAQGSAATAAAAYSAAQALLASHAGQAYVAAVAVGTDTFLFYDDHGVGGAIDAGIKVDHVAASVFNANGIDFV